MSNTHVIRRLTFEIHIPSEEKGFNIQEAISDIFNRILLRELEKQLDQLDSRHEVISIDKLELDLGSIDENSLEQELPMKVTEHLEEMLTGAITAARINNTSEVHAGDKKTSVTIKPANTSKLDLLLHFIQTGTMPWWARHEERSVNVLIVKLIEESPAQLRSALENILHKESYTKRIIYQLPDALITEVIKLFDRSFAGFAADTVNDICTIHGRNSFTSLSSQTMRLECWKFFIRQVIEKNTGSRVTEKADHLRKLILELQPAGDALLFVIRKARQMQDEQILRTTDLADLLVIAKKQAGVKENGESESGRRAKTTKKNSKDAGNPINKKGHENDDEEDDPGAIHSKNIKIKKAKHSKQDKTDRLQKDNNDPLNRNNDHPLQRGDEDTLPESNEPLQSSNEKTTSSDPGTAPVNRIGDISRDKTSHDKKQDKKELLHEQLKKVFSIEKNVDFEDVLTDGIYINNAGLVLVWPYILPFFRKLELVNGNVFISEESRHRGVHILQYLATGENAPAEEHELILNKLLCGIAPGEPISVFAPLSKNERKECEKLLENIITNWSALKKISISALRTTFIAKEGILQRDNDWSLKIERTTVDMLIDRLPWGISIIKLPWNNEMIYVEW